MSAVTRLVTFVDLDDRANDDASSVSARHEAELADGSRVLLLDDRGWASSGPCDIWAYVSVKDVVSEARPWSGQTSHLAADTGRHGGRPLGHAAANRSAAGSGHGRGRASAATARRRSQSAATRTRPSLISTDDGQPPPARCSIDQWTHGEGVMTSPRGQALIYNHRRPTRAARPSAIFHRNRSAPDKVEHRGGSRAEGATAG